MREYPFELAVCAHLEAATDWVVSRQLGGGVHDGGGRVVDVVGVVPGPGFDDRRAITAETIPPAAVESDVGPGRAVAPRDAFDCGPEQARRAAERAVEVGFFERERRGGRSLVRQVARYPDWFDRLVAIENKPDLGSPGALGRQLRRDASLGLFDEVVLVTESYVTRVHRDRLPDAVGVWRFDPDDPDDPVTVVREADPLPVGDPGVEILDERPGRTEVRFVPADEKAARRRAVAERAYGKGWRTYSLPGCGRVAADSFAGTGGLPYCGYKDRVVNPANCGPDCHGFEAADPPDLDLDAERASSSPWDPDPEGRVRRQAGLGRFDAGE